MWNGEERVIDGMDHLLKDRPQLLVLCETSPGSGADRRLRALGMKARLIDAHGTAFGNYAYESDGQTGGASSSSIQEVHEVP